VPSTNRGPLALGYIRRHPLMTDPEQEGMRAALSSFADAGGLRLAEVYIDTPATPSRYGAMVTAAQRMHAIVILVADPDHLGPLGGRAAVEANINTYTNARLIVIPDAGPQFGEVGARGPSSTPHS